ncbi:hypothetical protein [Altererythrobacter sp. MF3-039]|uniref:hypothetical protein n=1 Tax=Altererythrobacter sp. MF3-039 TaxID=3252901 RepID=UPI00390C7C6E
MSEVNFASLNQSLLARKGGAKPAMRSQLGSVSALPLAANAVEALEDLGWNDLGDDQFHTAEIVELAPPQGKRAELAKAKTSVTSTKPRRKAKSQGKRAAFTLRLDAQRHLKLRLASTIKDRSAQELVTEALDALLDTMPEITALASQVDAN